MKTITLICMILFLVAIVVTIVMEEKDSEYAWIPAIVGVVVFIIALSDSLKEFLTIVLSTIGGIVVLGVLLYFFLRGQGHC